MPERVEIEFPVHVVLAGSHAGRDGELHGVPFRNGVSVISLAYHEARRLSLAAVIHDLGSGVRIHPVTEKREWHAEERSKFWNRLRLLREDKRREARLAALAGGAMARLEGKPFAEALSSARAAAWTQLEAEEAEISATQAQQAIPAPPEAVLAPIEISATQAADDAGKATQGGATAPERQASADTAERGDDERRLALLRAALQLRGARTLRDAAKAAGVEAARSGQELVAALASSPLPLAELRKLAEDVAGG